MRVARRPPWHVDGNRPHVQWSGRFRVPGRDVTWPKACSAVIYRTPEVVQVHGYMDELVDSKYLLVVPCPKDVVASDWLEVVDMDDWWLWRMTGDQARRRMARVKRAGEVISMLYLGSFRVVRIDRDTRDKVRHMAKAQGWR